MSASPYYLGLLERMAALHRAKAAGYSGEGETWGNFREAEQWGATPLLGCLIRMGDKYRRVQNLTRDPANEQVGEAVTDTLMDLASYALIAICLLNERAELLNAAREIAQDRTGHCNLRSATVANRTPAEGDHR